MTFPKTSGSTLRETLKHLLTAAAIATACPALAQDSVQISFPSGATGTTINGTVRGDEYIDYVLNARGGQTMDVALTVTGTNGNGSAYFNILPAGQDFGGPYTGSDDDDNRAEVIVPYDGDWAIRVYLMGNDRDADKTVGFSIDVYIAASAGGGSGGSSASAPALLPEEDIFVVRLSGGGSALNVRSAPRPSAQKIGELRNGTMVSNIGGCTISNGQQWCKVKASPYGVSGWVAARFLALPGPGGGGNAPSNPGSGGGDFATVSGVPANDLLNVRSGPGSDYGIIGALTNGDSVRKLHCEAATGGSWCEIEMQTDMRERGWVNARYLGGGAGGIVTQLPSASRFQTIRFAPGDSGTSFSDELGPGTSVTYVIGARNGQFLYFLLDSTSPALGYKIFNPDNSVLLDEMSAIQDYRGQLWQSGDHKIEVFNRGSNVEVFDIVMSVK